MRNKDVGWDKEDAAETEAKGTVVICVGNESFTSLRT